MIIAPIFFAYFRGEILEKNFFNSNIVHFFILKLLMYAIVSGIIENSIVIDYLISKNVFFVMYF